VSRVSAVASRDRGAARAPACGARVVAECPRDVTVSVHFVEAHNMDRNACADRQAAGRHPRSSRVGQGSGEVLRRLARRYAPACATAPKRARRWRVPGQEAAGSGPSWPSKDRTHMRRRPRTSRSSVPWPCGAATLANAALISLLAALLQLVVLRRKLRCPWPSNLLSD
jgi:hypothetical protein